MGPKYPSIGARECRDNCDEGSAYCDLLCPGPKEHKQLVEIYTEALPTEETSSVLLIGDIDQAIAFAMIDPPVNIGHA